MSNPNTNALALSNRRYIDTTANRDTNSGIKLVHIGKDMQPVTIVKMSSINSHAWKKSACFDSLQTTIYNLAESHTVADIISLVSQELPLDTGASYQASEAAAKSVIANVCKINILEPLCFLSSSGRTLAITDPDDLDARPDDITYLRVRCNLDGKVVDKRVNRAEPISFQFCLKLPQYLYDTNTKNVSPIAPISTQSNTARSLSSCFAATTTPSTPSTSTNTTSTTSSSTTSAVKSPAMQLLFKKNSSSSGSDKKGFYGALTFLDSQMEFDSVFGKSPQILPSNPLQNDVHSIKKILLPYSDLCKLDIFMNLCMLNYVGTTTIDPSLNVQEVCRKISSLRQQYTVRGRGVTTDTPDELFDKFLVLCVSLPDDASTWSIQLCSSYLSALTKDLAENMTSEPSFKMPELTTLSTKALQIEALRLVRTCAVASYQSMLKQEDKISSLIRSLHSNNSRGTQSRQFGSSNVINSGIPAHGHSLFQQGPSLAEQTLSKYNGGSNNLPQPNIETRIHPKTGLPHPYTPSTGYLSEYPLGFKGCFNCGKTDHWRSTHCPLRLAGIFDKTRFFKELWAHKPHTKRDDNSMKSNNGNINMPNTNSRYESNYANRNMSITNNSNIANNSNEAYVSTTPNTPNILSCNQLDNTNTAHASSFNTMHQPVYQPNQNLFNSPHPGFSHNATNGNNLGSNVVKPGLDMNNNLNDGANNRSILPDVPNSANNANDHNHHNDRSYYGPRNIDNSPAWRKTGNQNDDNDSSVRKDTSTKKQRLWVMSAHMLNTSGSREVRPMPLSLDNNLPAAVFRFGSTDTNEIPFSCHIDTCAAMNTGNLRLHQWIMTEYPEIVESYEEYTDANPFNPIALDCAVPVSNQDDNSNKLTAVVTYKTRYVDKSGKKLTISFGLGESISVNAILGLPTIKSLKLVLDIDGGRAISKVLDIYFDLVFQNAASGFPAGVSFDKKDFKRPPVKNDSGLALLSRIASSNATLTNLAAPVSSFHGSAVGKKPPSNEGMNE